MDGALLADLIVVLHMGFVLFVIVTEAAVLVGAWRGWRWIRRRMLRRVHLACAWIPALEVLAGVICPLTKWENALRRAAGERREESGFIARLVGDILFYEAPPWAFGASYVAFASLVTLTYVWIRPRRERRAALASGLLEKDPS